MQRGSVILCGGKSKRMGRDKALLSLGSESMLQRVVRIVSAAVPTERIVVVAAREQQLPALPKEVIIARDRQVDCGPAAGLARGLETLAGKADAVFVTGCDTPLVRPEVINHLFTHLQKFEAVVDEERSYPLTAVYRADIQAKIKQYLQGENHSLQGLLAKLEVYSINSEAIRAVDPDLESLQNINTPQQYHEVAERFAGHLPPQ